MTMVRLLLLVSIGITGIACSSVAGSDGVTARDLLVGKTWVLNQVRQNGFMIDIDPDQVPLTMRLNDDGTAYGEVGCNRWNGRYRERPDYFRLESAASSRRLCHYDRPVVGRLANRFLDTLQSPNRYSVTESTLILRTSAGHDWEFSPVGE